LKTTPHVYSDPLEISEEQMRNGQYATEHEKHLKKWRPERHKELTENGKLYGHLIYTEQSVQKYIKQAVDWLMTHDKEFLKAKALP
jgi:hypothetical protein